MGYAPPMVDEYEKSELQRSSTTFDAAKKVAEDLLALYANAGVSLSSQCSLGQLIRDAIALADAWVAGKIIDDTDPLPIIRGQQLDKIARAALPLAGMAENKNHLLALKRGCLDPLARKQSPAKDKLWELELWTILNGLGIPAVLAEPDIVVSTTSGDIGIACKRIYSLANAAKSMSDGIGQIKGTGLTGLLAVNIDDVAMPAGVVIAAASIESASKLLNNINLKFIDYHRVGLLEYVSTGRSAAVMVSTSAPLYLENEGIRECRQSQFWTHPHLDASKKKHILEFEKALFRDL
jgi:hypothetical protein